MSHLSPRTFLANRVAFLLVLMVIVMVVMSLLSPYFLNVDNLLGMTRFGAVLALIGIGQSLVILAGGAGIDISVGSIISLSGVLFGLMVKADVPLALAIPACVVVGALLGAVNGVTVALWGMPPMIGTFSTMWAYGALALVLTRGVPVSGFPEVFGFLGQGKILGIPAQTLLFVVPAYILFHFMLSRTSFGRSIYLVGVNDEAARFAGISPRKVRFALYTLSGALAGCGALIMSSWLMAARADVGNGMELQAITVAVLGGINIFGGSGSLLGTLLAVVIITMVQSGLQLANINAIWQLAVQGFILLGAVALNQSVLRERVRR